MVFVCTVATASDGTMTTAIGAGCDFDDTGLPIQKKNFFSMKKVEGVSGNGWLLMRKKGTRKKKKNYLKQMPLELAVILR